MLKVSLFTGPDYLIENEETVSAHAFNVTDGVIPEAGLIVPVDAPNLSEFDLESISVEGGEIAAVRDGGFDLRITEYTALVNLPIADDGETEAGETATFSLAAGEGYEIISNYSSGSFELVDTRDDIPGDVVTEPNDIVSVATDTGITPDNPSFSGADSLYFDIGNRYLNEDGTYTYIDYNEDVDLYQVDLSAGDTVAVETFEVQGNRDVIGNGLLSVVSAFDSDGNLVSFAPNRAFAAPDKLFGSIGTFNEDGTVNEDETDAYLEFTAPEDGVYYIGVSGDISGYPTFLGEDFTYDIETPGLGDDNRVVYGNYEIEIDLLTEENARNTGTPTTPVSNPNVTNPPTLSFSANPTTVDSEGNFTNSVVEFVKDGGISGVTFTIQTEGEIPEGGIEFVLNSNANLFDYVSVLGQNSLPSTIGGQSLGAFYDEDGIPTGIRLLIEEPTMTVNLERTNRASDLGEDLSFNFLFDQFEALETDGAEDVNFFLQPGEGYEVATDAETEVTYYDSVEDVPPSTGGGDTLPEVGITISESTLIESEGTETTFTFSLSEPPPESGVTVFLNSEDEASIGSVLGQFLVLEAEIEGGDFPIPNSDTSGFFFNITEQTATITVSVFDELTIVDDPFAVQEGLVAFNFALQPQSGYTIDSNASEIDLTIADNPESQILVSPTAATVDDEDSTTLIESESTLGVLNLSLSAPPPESGITVSVSTDSLDDFDTDSIEVEGGTIAAVREDGFDVTITERQANINLPVTSDETVEGSETATFTVEPSDTYETNQQATEVSFTLADTPDQASVSEEIEGNDILSEANALGLSADNSTVSINGAMSGFSSDAPGRFLGFAEDVDFYSVTLEAGQIISLDIDTDEPTVATPSFAVYPALEEILQQPDTELRLFDGTGNELAANNDGAAPDEEFSRDPYLEYTADSAGTYYVGVSQLGNDNYDPNEARSGSGWTFPEVGVFFGSYELTATLEDGTTNPPEEPTFEPVFGSIDGDTIEVEGNSQLIFAGDMNDLLDASTGEGNNRIYAGSGNDTLILGASDRIFGGAGDDAIFTTNGGENTITGGAGADQFWIASAELPESANIITDFIGSEDVIGIAGLSLGFSDLSIIDIEGDALISTNDSDLAIIQGVAADSLSADDFTFA